MALYYMHKWCTLYTDSKQITRKKRLLGAGVAFGLKVKTTRNFYSTLNDKSTLTQSDEWFYIDHNDMKVSSTGQSSISSNQPWQDSLQRQSSVGCTTSHIISLVHVLVRHSQDWIVPATRLAGRVSNLPVFAMLHHRCFAKQRQLYCPKRQ